MKRVMWIESKSGGLSGPARIGWAEIKNKGKRIDYGGLTFKTLRGDGYKANYCEIESRERYWISGCRRDGKDALYNTDVEIDGDALEEYWIKIRNLPENVKMKKFKARGKY